MKRTVSGFTIVELLVVIVVIGIIATISVVAYNGIQDRAHLTKTLAAATNYEKIVSLYNVNNGRFPNTGSYQFQTCLGTAADYPAQSGFEEGECISSDADWLSGRYIDTAFNNLLRNEEISLPSGNTQTVTDSNGKRYRGMVYVSPNTSRTATIWYWIKGEHDTCPKGNRQTGWPTGEGVTACAILIDPEGIINPSYSYSGHHGGEL